MLLALDVSSKLRRSVADGVSAQTIEMFLRCAQYASDLAVQALGDRFRGRTKDTEPWIELVAPSVSATVGIVGAADARLLLVTPNARNLPEAM